MKTFAIAMLLSLSACAVYTDDNGLHITGISSKGLSLDQLRQITLADLKAADAKAVAASDRQGSWCWQYLEAIPSPTGAGIASAIEDARIVAMAAVGPCSGILQPMIGVVGAVGGL